eukprot:gene20754-24925_t
MAAAVLHACRFSRHFSCRLLSPRAAGAAFAREVGLSIGFCCPGHASGAGRACIHAPVLRGGASQLLGNTVTYSIKEIFYTLQGEGAHAGRPAVFCRFSGCNLWTGRESDRATAVCQFCDTDFVGTDGELGGKFRTPAELAALIDSLWPASYPASKYVVFTGGEPLLQLDTALIDAMHAVGFTIAIETNGTLPVPPGVDWICVSPKMGSTLVVHKGNEIKVVIPQFQQDLAAYEGLDFENFFVQAMDGPLAAQNMQLAIETCKSKPKWKLSLQTHKLLQCRNLHGHRYTVEITLVGQVIEAEGNSDNGMIMDFSDVKTLAKQHLVDVWDHAFLVYEKDTAVRDFLASLPDHKTVVIDRIPTVENLARIAFEILKAAFTDHFGTGLHLHKLVLHETPNCWAEVTDD